MQKSVGVRTTGLSYASKIALLSVVAICLLISPFLASASSGSSPIGINSTRVTPNVHPRHTLTSPNAQSGGQFGLSVASSGNIVVVGASFETADGYSYAGHAYIFNAKTGALISNLTSPNAAEYGEFGTSVAVSGNIVVVGAPWETVSTNYGAGHAYIFNATGALIYTLTSPNEQASGLFGWSVAASGNIVVVGAYREFADGYNEAGNAYTFNAKTGALISNLTSPNAQSYGNFGYSVAVSGKIVVVGAPYEYCDGYYSCGHAYIFNAKTGALISNLTSPNVQSDIWFGYSVAASGKIVVIGAPYQTADGWSYAGQAYIFTAKTGALIYNLTSAIPQAYGWFGWSVAASGNMVVVGAPQESASGYFGAGNAYTFKAKTGALISNLTSPNPAQYGYFGYSVAVSGKIVVVGAPYETADGYSDAGHAYIFKAKT